MHIWEVEKEKAPHRAGKACHFICLLALSADWGANGGMQQARTNKHWAGSRKMAIQDSILARNFRATIHFLRTL